MKRPLAITSLLFILMAYVETFKSRKDDDHVYLCYIKLVCLTDKVEEIYKIVSGTGTKNIQKYIDVLRQVIDIEIPEFTLENWIQAKEIFCKLPEQKRGQLASTLYKYKAAGVCLCIGAVPDGMDKMWSSPFG
ncbi:unnamed protein product [Larinioides sclopetarius]